MIASWLPLLAQLDISLGKFETPKSPNPKGNGPQICSEIIGSAFSPEKGKIKNRLQLKATSCASSIWACQPPKASLALTWHLHKDTCMRTHTRTHTHTFTHIAQALGFISRALFPWSTGQILTDPIQLFLGVLWTFQAFFVFLST